MPLPFLTADRATEPPAVTDTAPHDHDRWRRPYRPGPWRVGGAALLLLLASYLLISTLIIALADSLPGAAACALSAALVIAFALRLLRVGVWVSAHGVRQVGLFRTTTLPWRRVATIRTAQQPVRWLGLPRTVQGEALLVFATGDGSVPTPLRPLLTDHNADFLSRPGGFNRAADVVETWAAEFGRSAAQAS
ncbi:hypothetical protein E0L36_13615 [Streptomyces sp. AJS327]|uniref:hypothetical protein n=1 Tax=Streptomyces sp. AJS327 TaxID=2545265 RepID=UPI0015DEF882|nr:hypothetical protein [Streptomyces sp. AJS327]MBA0051897.1 hypothetical protein [Streptomyces sp. AJS327]